MVRLSNGIHHCAGNASARRHHHHRWRREVPSMSKNGRSRSSPVPKNRTLDVGNKAKIRIGKTDESLDVLKSGQNVSLSFHDQLELVVIIEVKSDEFEAIGRTDVSLFNGLNFSGWRYDRGTSLVEREDAWTIGPSKLLICQGVSGHAFLLTDEKYRDFTLRLEWRIPEGVKSTKDGLGILVRANRLHTPDQQSIAFRIQRFSKGDGLGGRSVAAIYYRSRNTEQGLRKSFDFKRQ